MASPTPTTPPSPTPTTPPSPTPTTMPSRYGITHADHDAVAHHASPPVAMPLRGTIRTNISDLEDIR
jgi:hypothetical protein